MSIAMWAVIGLVLYLAIGFTSTVVIWVLLNDEPPEDYDDGLLLRMLALWPAYIVVAIGSFLAQGARTLLRRIMR